MVINNFLLKVKPRLKRHVAVGCVSGSSFRMNPGVTCMFFSVSVNFTAALSTLKLAAEEIKVYVIQELVQSRLEDSQLELRNT